MTDLDRGPSPGLHHLYLWPQIETLLPPGRLRVLDAGCGAGFVASKLAELGHEVTAIDISTQSLALARASVKGVGFEQRSVYDDLSDLKPPDGWDLIVSVEVIEHLFAPRALLAMAHDSLRPGGHLLLTTPYHGYVKNLVLGLTGGWDRHFSVHNEGGHIKFFSPASLRALLSTAGFSDLQFRYAGRAPLLWKSMVCRARSISSSTRPPVTSQ